jgi:hypothetical protein
MVALLLIFLAHHGEVAKNSEEAACTHVFASFAMPHRPELGIF